MTKLDRIRSFSDEELIDFLAKLIATVSCKSISSNKYFHSLPVKEYLKRELYEEATYGKG